MTVEAVPPPLRDLWTLARRLGYENPVVEEGDIQDGPLRASAVRVILYGSPARRQIAGHCRVLPVPDGRELAVRSALAKALELATES